MNKVQQKRFDSVYRKHVNALRRKGIVYQPSPTGSFNNGIGRGWRATYPYLLMDAAYDSPLIKKHDEALGYAPFIDANPRTTDRKAEIKDEQKASDMLVLKQRKTFVRMNAVL